MKKGVGMLAAALVAAVPAAAQLGERAGDGAVVAAAAATVVAQATPAPPTGRAAKEAERQRIRAEGREFLAANAKAEGVVSLPSGLQYRVLKEGTGASPGPGAAVVVRYKGTLVDGTVFGQSGDKTERFSLGSLVPGLAEALRLMKEGANWMVYIPAKLAFGERGPLEDRVVIYDVTLVSVEPEAKGP